MNTHKSMKKYNVEVLYVLRKEKLSAQEKMGQFDL